MIKAIVIQWQTGDLLARLDLGIVLEIDDFEPDTGEYFVLVGLWDENVQEYEFIEHSPSAVSVSGVELEAFVGSGVNPCAVRLLIDNVGK